MKTALSSWLDLQCRLMSGTLRGVLMLNQGEAHEPPTLVAWPIDSPSDPDLMIAAADAMARREVLAVQRPASEAGDPRAVLAYPIIVDGDLLGSVALERIGGDESDQAGIAQLIRLGTAWLEILLRHGAVVSGEHLLQVLEVTALSVEQSAFEAAATAVINHLADRLGCDRVSLGIRTRTGIQVIAVSHSARVQTKMNLLRRIQEAMEECLDQGRTVCLPDDASEQFVVRRRHQALAKAFGSGSICTVPFTVNDEFVGCLSLERTGDRPFPLETVELCEGISELVGPILYLKHREQRWIGARAVEAFHRGLGRMLGRGHPKLKLAAIGVVLGVAILALVESEYRVDAPASLEGSVQRAIVAPRDGYVLESNVRAGDRVNQGDVIARLDDRELRLERLRLAAERQQLVSEQRQAMGEGRRSNARVFAARIAQVDAELELTEHQLELGAMGAPIDGVLVTGDLSQAIGAPVSKGEVLFEVAPLDAYRIHLQVDERAVAQIEPGQSGAVKLIGLPDETFELRVDKVTPLAEAVDGRNSFRVEARLRDPGPTLRPGMQGIGKIEIGRRPLGWLLTHSLVDWVRLKLWSWGLS